METSGCFIFGNICACIDVLGKIDKYKPLSIVDLIVCPLGHFTLITFVLCQTLFRWADNAIKLPMYPESATE